MKDATHTVREELNYILLFVGAIWAAFFLNRLVFPVDFNKFGVVPRTISGAIGIPFMPFLHADLAHLLGNTIPLFVLLTLLAGSRARSWEIVAEIVVVSGVLLWLAGRSAMHIGASGLVFGLATFLILSGLLERRIVPLLISLLVGFLYGGTLISGVLPGAGPNVSWDGHLCGAVAGGLSAYFLTKDSSEAKPRSERIDRR
ncbi:MAG TPA: rhomboid family intramembrane serine protease [Thermoguttaceae bacterium]|nr:rhomboid family intramembrane serine protease [Thermoguttaceae bacterium]